MLRPTLVLALTVITAVPAQAFIAANGLPVQPGAEARFTVPYAGDPAPRAFWCAAGDYVVRGLGQGPATQIYRASPVPRHPGEGMAFSLLAADSAGKTGFAILGGEGGGLTAALAQGFCNKMDGD